MSGVSRCQNGSMPDDLVVDMLTLCRRVGSDLVVPGPTPMAGVAEDLGEGTI